MPMLSPSMQPTTADLLPKGRLIASYATYSAAQEAVDYLSDENFPVQHVTIVGTGLQLIENVTGRLSYPRMALNGAASGAQFGLMVGILMSLVNAEAGMLESITIAVGLGVAIGMIFAVLSYGFTRGKRDFTSMSHVIASEYTVVCHEDHADEAITKLREGGKADPAAAARGAVDVTRDGTVGDDAAPQTHGTSDVESSEQPADSGPKLTYGEAIDLQRKKRAQQRAEGEGASPSADHPEDPSDTGRKA